MTRNGHWKLQNLNFGSHKSKVCHPEGGVRPRDLLFAVAETKSRFLAPLGMTIKRGSLRYFVTLWLCGISLLLFPAPVRAQSLDKPTTPTDKDILSFLFAPTDESSIPSAACTETKNTT